MGGRGSTGVRVGVIDIGTNTALLLIADVNPDGLDVLVDDERFVRLGEHVDADGFIGAAALDRLVNTLRGYARQIRAHRIRRIDVAATSAFRDAANRESVARAVREQTGLEIRAINGDEEARLTFDGGLFCLGIKQGIHVTLDIGGGSTELTAGRIDAGNISIDRALSTRCGAIRIRERFFRSVPPDPDDVAAAMSFIDSELASFQDSSREIVGTSGTTRALGILEGDIQPTGQRRAMSRDRIDEWLDRLMRLSPEEVLALNPHIMRGREDVFGAAVLVLSCAMHRLGAAELVISSGGLRHGLARRLAGV